MKTLKVKEAKHKICPFMSDNTMGRDYNGNYNGVSYCVCGDCMAWEYTKTYKTKKENIKNLNKVDKELYDSLIKAFNTVSETTIDTTDPREVSLLNKLNDFDLPKEEKEGFCRRLS